MSAIVPVPPNTLRRAGRRARDWAPAAAVLVAGIVAWQGLVTAFDIQRFLLPKPTEIATALRENWTFLRHEDISREPVPAFELLFATLGVEFDDSIRHGIAEHSDPGNPVELRESHDIRLDSRAGVDSWRRRLSAGDIERIRIGVADVAPAFYSDVDW